MRVLFVTDFYHPYIGGVEVHVRAVAAELAARGHDVAVATLDTPPGEPPRDADGPVRIYTVAHSAQRAAGGFANAGRQWAPPVPDPVTMRGLRRVVADFEPDVVHGHDWLARSALPKRVAGSVPVVISHHYYTRTCAKKTLWRDGGVCDGPALARCLPCGRDHYGAVRGTAVVLGVLAGARLEDRRAAAVISVSEATAAGNGLAGRPGASVIPNPLTVAPGEPPALPPEVAASLPTGDFVLYVGDMRREKGVAVLIDAVEALAADGRPLPLVAAGETMADGLALPAEVVQLGRLDHGVVQALWRRAAVGVVPSIWPEPFGLVATEAMAAGCPVVASDIGGLREIVTADAGILVPPGDPAALAAALTSLLDDPQRRAALGAGAAVAAERYRVETVVDRIEAEYRVAVPAR